MSVNHEKWIRNELVPLLMTQNKFSHSDKIHENGFSPKLKNISIESLSTGETFMLTNCYRVKVFLVNDDGKEQCCSLVVNKTPNVDKFTYDAASYDALFSNEINAYTVILPELNFNEKCVKYYYSYRKKTEATIVLEDFSVKGWQMTKKMYDLSVEHLLLAVKELGEFHGSAYHLKLTRPEKFNKIVSSLVESRLNKDIPESWQMIMQQTQERFSENIETNDLPKKVPREFLDKLKETIFSTVKFMQATMQPIEPIATLCHGDYLRNNIAFWYSDKNPNIPIDVIMFDFQTLRYASPMFDLCTIMLMTASSETRSKHFHTIFRTYWDSLIQKLCSKGDLKPENLPEFLSYDNMIREYVKYFIHGLNITTFFLMEMIAPLKVSPETFVGLASDIFDSRNRGGEAVDSEIRAAVLELYELTRKYDVDIFEHFDKLSQDL